MRRTIPAEEAVLFVAHPGHELRIHGWLERMRPLVCVLTDGSGYGGIRRLDSTTRTLRRAEATCGSIYGRLSDQDVYAALLNHDHNAFLRLAEELAMILTDERIGCVVGDASEGEILSHDVCSLIMDAAVVTANRTRKQPLTAFDFSPMSRPFPASEEPPPGAICLVLEDDEFERKMAAIRACPEIRAEAEEVIRHLGEDSLRVEWLLRVVRGNEAGPPPDAPPLYERHGERQLMAGRYKKVVRYREHVAPLAEALRLYAQSGVG